ncbi:MAG: pilus assembly protein PilM [Patescibacteria group bacterium]
MSLFKKIESHLGIDIGAGGIKLVELRKTKNHPQLWTYGILDTPLDVHLPAPVPEPDKDSKTERKLKPAIPADPRVEKYGTLLKDLLKKTKVTTKHVTVSLPVSQVFHALITLPVLPEKEIDWHVRAKVTKMLPRPIDEMQIVYQRLQHEGADPAKDIKVLVTAADKSLIRFYTDIFSYADLVLDDLETEAFALERSLVGRDAATVMVVDIGAERTNFFIIDSSVPVTHRSIQIGGHDIDRILADTLGVEAQHIPQIKFDISQNSGIPLPGDAWLAVVDSIVKEIEYGFELYLHQSGNEQKRPEKIILTGGAALFPPIAAAISGHFPMKVFVGDPWARVVYQDRLKPLLDVIGPRMSVAIGLALRNLAK